ncbi:hypothetical protein [Sphingomonas sp. 3-13AW]|uniref:hypothetical protein n=1 Tax=Sphingomonas sp. 3-13AW TaxID=3050450 RepID=UPI003BB59EC7
MNTMDLWDDAGAFLYRHFPEMSLVDFFTEEREMLQISREHGKYWLSDTRAAGATPYDDVGAAKAAGDEAIADAETTLDACLFAEARLSPAVWSVNLEDGLSFVEKDGPLCIVAQTDGGPRKPLWALYDGEDAVVSEAGDIATVVSAAGKCRS